MPNRRRRRQRALLGWGLLAIVLIAGALIGPVEDLMNVTVTAVLVGGGGLWLASRLIGLGWSTLQSEAEDRSPVPAWAQAVGLPVLVDLTPVSPPVGLDDTETVVPVSADTETPVSGDTAPVPPVGVSSDGEPGR